MYSRLLLLFLTFSNGHVSFAQQQDTTKLDIYLEQLRVQYREVDFFNSQSDSIYKVLSGTNFTKQKAVASKFRGMSNYARGNFDSAIYYYTEGLQLNRSIQDSLEMGKGFVNLAGSYNGLYQFDSAVSNALQARELFELISDPKGINHVNNLIGGFYYYRKDYNIALQYFKNNLKLNTDASDTLEMVIALNNMGAVYEELDLPDSIIYCSVQVLYLGKFIKLNNPGYTYQNLGLAYFKKGEFKESINNFKKAENEYRIQSRKNFYGDIYYYLGRNYKALEDYTSATNYFEKALTISNEKANINAKKEALKSLAEIQRITGKSSDAYDNLEKYIALNDTILNEENQRNITEMQAKYDSESKERQIALQNSELREREADLTNRTLTIIALVTFILLVIAVAYFYFYKQKKNQEVALREQALEFSELQLQAAINSQETERRRFATDLHDGFGQVISILKMNVDRIIGNGTDDLEHRTIVYEETKGMLDKMNDELRGICFDLMPQTLLQSGLVAAVKEFAVRVNLAGKVVVELHVFGMEERLAEIVEVSLYRVIQEWTNNILKYGSATKITVQLTQDTKELTLTIEDNGAGFDTNLLTQSKGNGWKNIQSRTKLMTGEVWVDSRPNISGSTLTINLNPQQVFATTKG